MGIPELIHAWKGEEFREVLRRMYLDEGKSIKQIAKELHIGVGTVHLYLCRYKISHTNDIWELKTDDE